MSGDKDPLRRDKEMMVASASAKGVDAVGREAKARVARIVFTALISNHDVDPTGMHPTSFFSKPPLDGLARVLKTRSFLLVYPWQESP